MLDLKSMFKATPIGAIGSHVITKKPGEVIQLQWGCSNNSQNDAWCALNVFHLDDGGNVLQWIGGTGATALPAGTSLPLDASGVISDNWPVNVPNNALLQVSVGFDLEQTLPWAIEEHEFTLTVIDEAPPIPTVPPTPSQFQNVVFTLTTFYETEDGPVASVIGVPGIGTVMKNMDCPVNRRCSIEMTVKGEYRGAEAAYVQGRLFGQDPIFGGIAALSFETLLPATPDKFTPFGPIEVGRLGWQAETFPIGDTWQAMAELISTNGQAQMLGDFPLFDTQKTVVITKGIWGIPEIKGPVEVIDRLGRHTDAGPVTINFDGDNVIFIVPVRNSTAMEAVVEMRIHCGFTWRDSLRRLRFTTVEKTVEQFVIPANTQLDVFRDQIIAPTAEDGTKVTCSYIQCWLDAPPSDDENWFPRLFNPDNLDFIFNAAVDDTSR